MANPVPESIKMIDNMTDGEVAKLFEYLLKSRGENIKDFVSDPIGEYKEMFADPKAKLVDEPMQMLKGDIEYGKEAIGRMKGVEKSDAPQGRVIMEEPTLEMYRPPAKDRKRDFARKAADILDFRGLAAEAAERAYTQFQNQEYPYIGRENPPTEQTHSLMKKKEEEEK